MLSLDYDEEVKRTHLNQPQLRLVESYMRQERGKMVAVENDLTKDLTELRHHREHTDRTCSS